MKNQLIIVYLLLCSSVAFAQPIIGVKGGLSLAKIVDGNENISSLTLFHAGLSGRFRVSDAFHMQPELVYAKKGVDHSQGTVNHLQLKFEYDYLSLPVLGGLQFGKGFSFHFGPVLNYLLTIKSTVGTETWTGKGVVPDWEFGLLGGLEYKFSRFSVYTRYEMGLTRHQTFQLTDINGLSIGLVEGGKNRVFQLGVGVAINEPKTALSE